jgi:hypothetical protein
MKLNLPTTLMEKLVWVLVILFCKIFIPKLGAHLMPYYVETGPLNRLTLLIVLLYTLLSFPFLEGKFLRSFF